ncbi:MAG: KH domain-containing protein [Hormoscilla sp. SP5CHS1]|nr:KH domain-containing protein [Hormoscilla sp. SP5CHS1]MBC6475565.1 KH domain-containing protein [Hormoscilla sp. GM102CHS1]
MASQSPGPDYAGLVQFLVEPFLESPEALSVDCEKSSSRQRVWIRLAFDVADKGRVYGRGGRNLQAINKVLTAAARAAGHSLYLDVYGGFKEAEENNGSAGPIIPKGRTVAKHQGRGSPILKPSRKSQSPD